MDSKFKKKNISDTVKNTDSQSESEQEELQAIDISAIKEYERKQRDKMLSNSPVKNELIDFDQWWDLRSPKLNQPSHVKEILRVDAKARKLAKLETLERWDWAARQYGLKI